jgi:ATP-binding cassette subfamily B multidrug efflux pump
MFRFFETLVDSTASPPGEPPSGLRTFYWHFIAQAKGLFAALFALGFVLAVVEAVVPYLIGRLVNCLSSVPRLSAFSRGAGRCSWPWRRSCSWCGRWARSCFACSSTTRLPSPSPRWFIGRITGTWCASRSGFFQEDFAGRFANRVLQTGRPLRETVVCRGARRLADPDFRRDLHRSSRHAGHSPGRAHGRPGSVLWCAARLPLPKHAGPLARDLERGASAVSGKVVDSFTNIMTVKLFGRRTRTTYISDGYRRASTTLSPASSVSTPSMCSASSSSTRSFWSTTGGIGVWLFTLGPRRCGHADHRRSADNPDHRHVKLGGVRNRRDLREYRHRAGGHEDDRAAAEPCSTSLTRAR